MTTNVFCMKSNVLASDSRWSYRIDDRLSTTLAIAYIDNTGYDKIAFDEDTGYIFAGPGVVIDAWRSWAISQAQDMLKRPAVANDFSICMTDLQTGEILMEHGQKVQDEYCRTAGTGAKVAYECWVDNQDACRAVGTAMKLDPFSGGDVKSLVGANKAHNLNFSVEFSSIAKLFLQKGMVMYPTSEEPAVPLAQAAKDDPRIQHLVNKVKIGQLAAEAPSGYDPVVWTPADEQRLDEALARRNAKRSS